MPDPKPNDLLRHARLRLDSMRSPGENISRQELADLVASWIFQEKDGRVVPIDDHYIGKLERGVVRWPQEDYRSALRAIFGAKTDSELGFYRRRRAESVRPAGFTENRRQALAAGAATLGLAAAGGPLPWMSSSASAMLGDAELRVGSEEVELLRSAAADLDAIDQRFGGDRLWRSARAQLLWLHRLLDQGTYTDGISQELHSITGQLTTSLGWFCYDAGRQTEARVYFSEALNTAMLAGDDALATRTLSNMARQSVDLGKAREAVRFARIAQAHAAEWSAPPRVAALLAIREAQGHARLGDDVSAGSAIKRAWTHFEHGSSQRDPDWTAFLNQAELTCLEGMCRLDLGQHNQSVKLLDRSAELQDIEHSRNRGMCLARLAYAALQNRDLDHTVAAAEESLRLVDGGMSSTRNMKQLVLVRNGLTLHRTHDPAREMAERLSLYTA
ncbi:hypothetical protein [Frankia sp. CiP1_Cm_nod1]|uniref:hypothetical protein n=1 Tax=Frankia sp. CiP1_Cm_nod1 TaxID=2897160 RepID=UPI0020253E55